MIAHAEPVQLWGLEPCGSLAPDSIPCLAGTAVRRTLRAPGAADSRSNVAEQLLCFYGRLILGGNGDLTMSTEDHHQRRRRRANYVRLFKLIVFIGQVALSVARFWIWMSDRR